MKKILFMLPVLAVCLASCENNKEEWTDDSPIIQFKDPKFSKALLKVREIVIYDVGQDDYVDYLVDIDTNRDGQISVNEAKNVIGLNLSSSGITDMSEIKYFTALTYLNCAYNDLTSLDVSNNAALTALSYDNNFLSTITISSNQRNAVWMNSIYYYYPDIEIIEK